MQDITKFANDQVSEKNKNMAEYKSRNTRMVSVLDQVWISTKNLDLKDGKGIVKPNPKFCGPFKITE